MAWEVLAWVVAAMVPLAATGLRERYRRYVRRRWTLFAAAEFDERTECEAAGDRWIGTLDGLSWTLFTPPIPPTQVKLSGALWVRVDADIGWRATPRAAGAGPLDGALGDPWFDQHVDLHDDVGCAAAVLTGQARAAVIGWLRAGGRVDASGIELPIAWSELSPEELFPWMRDQVALLHTLVLPADPRAALVARLSDPDLTTRLFAASTLGADLPQEHRPAVLEDAWRRLAEAEPPRRVVDLLTRLEVRGDGVTRRLVGLLGSPQPGVAPSVILALGSLGTTDAVMPLLAARPGALGDARLRAAVDASLAAIRATLKGVEGGRLAVVEDDASRGGLSVVDGDAEAGRVSVAADAVGGRPSVGKPTPDE
jgi:hypothetical protein